MKKYLVVLLPLSFAVWAIECVANMNCPFCDPSILQKQMVYQDEQCAAILNYKPVVQGHMLIIPNRHVERFEHLTKEELAAVGSMIAKVNEAEERIFGATGYLLMQKNGKEAGQSVPHVHFHYFPRKAGQNNIWLAMKIFTAYWQKSLTAQRLEEIKSQF